MVPSYSTILPQHKIVPSYTSPTQFTCAGSIDPLLSSRTLGYLSTPIISNSESLQGKRFVASLQGCGSVLARNCNGVGGSGDAQRPAQCHQLKR